MLMKPNKKNMASLIVAKIGGKEDDAEKIVEQPKDATGAAVDMEMDGPAVAADEVFAALEAKDKAAFIDAMKSMVSMCMNSEEDYEKSE